MSGAAPGEAGDVVDVKREDAVPGGVYPGHAVLGGIERGQAVDPGVHVAAVEVRGSRAVRRRRRGSCSPVGDAAGVDADDGRAAWRDYTSPTGTRPHCLAAIFMSLQNRNRPHAHHARRGCVTIADV